MAARWPGGGRALLRDGELATTAISLFELTSGPGTTPAQLELLQLELAAVPVLPLTRGSADTAAEVGDREVQWVEPLRPATHRPRGPPARA